MTDILLITFVLFIVHLLVEFKSSPWVVHLLYYTTQWKWTETHPLPTLHCWGMRTGLFEQTDTTRTPGTAVLLQKQASLMNRRSVWCLEFGRSQRARLMNMYLALDCQLSQSPSHLPLPLLLLSFKLRSVDAWPLPRASV